jgi:hypothetical protein
MSVDGIKAHLSQYLQPLYGTSSDTSLLQRCLASFSPVRPTTRRLNLIQLDSNVVQSTMLKKSRPSRTIFQCKSQTKSRDHTRRRRNRCPFSSSESNDLPQLYGHDAVAKNRRHGPPSNHDVVIVLVIAAADDDSWRASFLGGKRDMCRRLETEKRVKCPTWSCEQRNDDDDVDNNNALPVSMGLRDAAAPPCIACVRARCQHGMMHAATGRARHANVDSGGRPVGPFSSQLEQQGRREAAAVAAASAAAVAAAAARDRCAWWPTATSAAPPTNATDPRCAAWRGMATVGVGKRLRSASQDDEHPSSDRQRWRQGRRPSSRRLQHRCVYQINNGVPSTMLISS